MTEKSRSALYTGFSELIDNEEAVQEMLSYFPARDVEEPVTKEFLRATLAETELRIITTLRSEISGQGSDLRSEISGQGSDLRSEISGQGSDLRSEINSLAAQLRSEMNDLAAQLRSEMNDLAAQLRSEMRRMVWINAATLTAFAGVIIAAVRL
ncbi:MAG: hypothetical protein V9F03_05410 [Microthrixaceae bacterium]